MPLTWRRGPRGPGGPALWTAAGLLVAGLLSTAAAVSAAEAPSAPAPLSPGGARTTGAFLGFRAAIDTALERHPLLLKAHRTALAAQAVTEQAKARFYPQIDAYFIQTGGTIRPLSAFNIAGAQNKPTSYVENAGFRADQLIYDFGQTVHRVEAERRGEEAARKDVLTHKALVILRVQQAYLQVLRQKRLVQIAEEMVRERGVLRDQIATLYKRDLKSKLDLDLISIELRNAEVQLVQAKSELRAAYASLNNAMGGQGPDEYTLEEPPPSAVTGTLESLIQEGLAERPEVLSSEQRIGQAEEQVSAAKALYFPTVMAMGLSGVTHFSDAPLNQYGGAHSGQTNLWWGAAVRLSVPIFTGFLIENRVAEARQQQLKIEQEKLDLTNRITVEVTDAFLTRVAAEQQIKVEEREVQASRNALMLAKERYRMGLSSIVDVTTATTELLAAEVRLSEATYSYQASTLALEYAVGRGYRQF